MTSVVLYGPYGLSISSENVYHSHSHTSHMTNLKLSCMNEMRLTLFSPSIQRLELQISPVVENICSTGTDDDDIGR